MSTEQHEAPHPLGGASLIDIKRIAGQAESAAITARGLTDTLANAYSELQKQNVRQHALIVQMAEAMSDLNLNIGEAMAAGGWVPSPLHASFWEASANAIGAHAAATQYLKGPKP